MRRRRREEEGVTSALVGLSVLALLVLAAIVAPRDIAKHERRGMVTDCQRDPLRPYKRPGRRRDTSD
jgi:hypothetical protein